MRTGDTRRLCAGKRSDHEAANKSEHHKRPNLSTTVRPCPVILPSGCPDSCHFSCFKASSPFLPCCNRLGWLFSVENRTANHQFCRFKEKPRKRKISFATSGNIVNKCHRNGQYSTCTFKSESTKAVVSFKKRKNAILFTHIRYVRLFFLFFFPCELRFKTYH